MPRETLSLLVTAPITLGILWLLITPTPRNRNVVASEDYAVYAAVLGSRTRTLVSRDLIPARDLPDRRWWARDRSSWASIEAPQPSLDTLEDFQQVNRRLLQLDVAPLASLPVILKTNRELRQLKKRDDQLWVPVVHMSRVGFNREWTEAVVYVQYMCGPWCGGGGFILLGKVDGTWRIRASRSSWVA